jgi:hypothetical protein
MRQRLLVLILCASLVQAQSEWQPERMPRGRGVTVQTIARGPAVRGTVIAATPAGLELRLPDDSVRSLAREEIRRVTARRPRMSWAPLIGAAAGFGVGVAVFRHEDLVLLGTVLLSAATAGIGALVGAVV